jgi:hypothetical protein
MKIVQKEIKAHIESDLEYSKRVSKIDMDDMWVCDYCGSEEVQTRAWIIINTEQVMDTLDDIYWCDGCRDSVNAITYFEFKEKIAEECGGNKDKYDEIMDGSRM